MTKKRKTAKKPRPKPATKLGKTLIIKEIDPLGARSLGKG